MLSKIWPFRSEWTEELEPILVSKKDLLRIGKPAYRNICWMDRVSLWSLFQFSKILQVDDLHRQFLLINEQEFQFIRWKMGLSEFSIFISWDLLIIEINLIIFVYQKFIMHGCCRETITAFTEDNLFFHQIKTYCLFAICVHDYLISHEFDK